MVRKRKSLSIFVLVVVILALNPLPSHAQGAIFIDCGFLNLIGFSGSIPKERIAKNCGVPDDATNIAAYYRVTQSTNGGAYIRVWSEITGGGFACGTNGNIGEECTWPHPGPHDNTTSFFIDYTCSPSREPCLSGGAEIAVGYYYDIPATATPTASPTAFATTTPTTTPQPTATGTPYPTLPPTPTKTPTTQAPTATPRTPTATIPPGCGFGGCGPEETPEVSIGPTSTAPNFNLPQYQGPATAIPDVSLPYIARLPNPPAWNLPDPDPLQTPDVPQINLPVVSQPTLAPVSTFFGVYYPTPGPISSTMEITSTMAVTGLVNMMMETQSTISGFVSYTNYISETIYQVTLATDTIEIYTAPSWYAPALPRPMADIGWQFENMGQDVRKRYSIAEWGVLVARSLALPIQMVKGLNFLAALSGPFGLFLAWLLIMFPVVLVFKTLEFLKNTAIQLFNFIFEIVKFVISFIPGVG